MKFKKKEREKEDIKEKEEQEQEQEDNEDNRVRYRKITRTLAKLEWKSYVFLRSSLNLLRKDRVRMQEFPEGQTKPLSIYLSSLLL